METASQYKKIVLPLKAPNRFKRLAIISDCIHMYDGKGNVVTETHIFRRQMQMLASYFEQTVICCPFIEYTADKVTTAYSLNTIRFIPVPNAGGNKIKDKIKIIQTIPKWLQAFKKAAKQSDIVYMRFPNNLNIPGFFYFFFKRMKVFATFTGNWKNYPHEPFTYRFQKWLLKHFFKGPVWIYIGHPDSIDNKLFKGISPSYTYDEWEEETNQVAQRIEKLNSGNLKKPVFITVGALMEHKNQIFILRACKILHHQGFPFHLYVVGGGALLHEYTNFVEENNLEDCITFCGKKTHSELRVLYRRADFLIQAPVIEGYGKVPIEGLFHGVIPLLSNTAVAKEMTGKNNERGFIFSIDKPENLASLIEAAAKNIKALPGLITNGRMYARAHTLENWSYAYINTINHYFE